MTIVITVIVVVVVVVVVAVVGVVGVDEVGEYFPYYGSTRGPVYATRRSCPRQEKVRVGECMLECEYGCESVSLGV